LTTRSSGGFCPWSPPELPGLDGGVLVPVSVELPVSVVGEDVAVSGVEPRVVEPPLGEEPPVSWRLPAPPWPSSSRSSAA